MEKLIAVFTTSDIQYHSWPELFQAGLKSTGKLERAIAEGFTIYVVSTRTKLSETDAWWRVHVPDERIFLSSENVDGGYVNSPSTITPWERLYDVLGLTPMDLSRADIVEAEKKEMTPRAFACWMDANYQLASHGIRQGSSFRATIQDKESLQIKGPKVRDLFNLISEEVYYGTNLRLVLLDSSDEELEIIQRVFSRAPKARGK